MSISFQAANFQAGRPPRASTASARGVRAKRAFDVLACCLLILILLPLLAVIAVIVRLDGGPALFRHRRIGADGRAFMCLKFRSMKQDGDALLAALFELEPVAEAEWRQTQKLRNDPRVTPIGRLLRKTSFDELPQLFNVIMNDMSLVGPRPITAEEAVRYGGMMRYYCASKPGITGLWQVSGRSSTSYERRIELDVAYVQNWTFRKDLVILAKTIPAVLSREGAC